MSTISDSQIKVSSIMFTDIVGYSKMVGNDENHALQLLDAHNQILTTAIDKFGGSVIKFIGDSVFAEFSKPEAAANCAIDIQKKLIDRNKIHSKNDRVHIRIGLHMGDLVVKGDDLFGNTVNLGSRIEGVAPSDGILISHPVYNAINRDASFFTKQLGFAKLKNIKDPCQLHKLYLDRLAFTGQSDEDLQKESLERGLQTVDMDTYNPQEVYSIGVMYFKNLGESEDEILCRGIVQEIVKDMSTINALRIPSATEIDQYLDTDLPISEVARRMQSENMLIGSILKEEETFTLNVEMQDMKIGTSYFEETYVFKGSEISTVKGKLLLNILSQFGLDLPDHVAKIFQEEPTSNPEAMEHYIRGRHLMDVPKSSNHLREAREHFNYATVLDPAFLYAHTYKGWVSFIEGNYDEAEEEFYSALDLAKQDNLDTNDAYVYAYMGTLYNKLGKYNKSIRYHEMSLNIFLKYNQRRRIAAVLHNMGDTLKNQGKVIEGMDCFKRSLTIKEEFEDYNQLASSYNQIASTYNSMGDYSLSIENARRSLGYFKSLDNRLFGAYTLMALSFSYAQLGLFSECAKHLESAREIFEEFNNLFFLGKIDALYGMKYFNEGKYDKAIALFEDGIEKIQLDEAREFVLIHSIELIHVLIYDKKYDKALKNIDKCRLLMRKIPDVDVDNEDRILIDAMIFYVNFIQNSGDIEKLEEFCNNLQNESHGHYLAWFYLSKAFSYAHMKQSAAECMKQAKKLLKDMENKISDPEHRKSFRNNLILHRKILA